VRPFVLLPISGRSSPAAVEPVPVVKAQPSITDEPLVSEGATGNGEESPLEDALAAKKSVHLSISLISRIHRIFKAKLQFVRNKLNLNSKKLSGTASERRRRFSSALVVKLGGKARSAAVGVAEPRIGHMATVGEDEEAELEEPAAEPECPIKETQPKEEIQPGIIPRVRKASSQQSLGAVRRKSHNHDSRRISRGGSDRSLDGGSHFHFHANAKRRAERRYSCANTNNLGLHLNLGDSDDEGEAAEEQAQDMRAQIAALKSKPRQAPTRY
jgi:hypothetical protein